MLLAFPRLERTVLWIGRRQISRLDLQHRLKSLGEILLNVGPLVGCGTGNLAQVGFDSPGQLGKPLVEDFLLDGFGLAFERGLQRGDLMLDLAVALFSLLRPRK